MDQHIRPATEPQTGLSTVRKIVLHGSNCSNLAIYEEAYWSYRCQPFHKTLSTQKHSLKVLRLNDVGITKFLADIDCEALERREAEDQAFFGSLVDFTTLRELRMPVRNLLDSKNGQERSQSLRDILPPNIELLWLAKTDMTEYTMLESQLRGLLEVRAHDFPSLRKIVLQFYQMELLPGEQEWQWKKKNWGVAESSKEAFAHV
ncbi:uncharacterized protein N7459_000915 [Penicillium hispanicum]|uniref:uncharacterized protein n=1 Tax=Penicillium hispanicum TaxID=1080232 RepID=UPI00254217B1|nr:uncharacterized protein N7459_000915 [Penicillium hispanicum]KAJ5594707.1 hypothetical protein N7459_000915 [Penicillium hispanicum]